MRLFAASLLLLLGTAVSAQPLQPVQRLPRIGIAGSDLDSCLSLGQVKGLDPQGDNFLAVRAIPSADGSEKDRLDPGRMIFICDKAGDWLGVVYDPDPAAQPGDCGVGSPVETERPYVGSCKWGWVSSRYVEVIAG